MADRTKRRKYSLEQAMQQNAEYFGFDLRDVIEIKNPDGTTEEFEITYRQFLDAETRDRVNDVYRRYEECDREPDIELSDGRTVPGPYKEPRQYNGELFDLEAEVAKALWGEEKYGRWIAAGGPPGFVIATWTRMDHQFAKRMRQDTKS